MSDWSNKLQLAPQLSFETSEESMDAFERMDTELRRQILKYQKDFGRESTEVMAEAASHDEAIAYLSTKFCRDLLRDILERGYVVASMMTFDADGPFGGPHVSIRIAVPV